MSEKDNSTKGKNLLDRRQFLKLSAMSAGVVAAGSLAGCGSDSNDSSSSSTTPVESPKSILPSASAWKFGIMSDTQWTMNDDGENPASCAVDIINQLNDAFVAHGVDFVVHVGDLNDDGRNSPYTETSAKDGTVYSYTTADAYGIRARYTQALYNSNIGYFPLRGNHDDSAGAATQFLNYFPQTRTGLQNDASVQAAAYAAYNPDEAYLPTISRTNTSSFTKGSGFSSPTTAGGQLNGLSYAFKANNATFVMLDQFTLPDGTVQKGGSVSGGTYYNNISTYNQSWMSTVLSSRASGTHAFVFAHKGLLTQDHSDILFGDPTTSGGAADLSAVDVTGMDNFIKALQTNKVKYFILGHDHMHDRSQVYTSDGATASVMQLVTSSNSSKFYIPQSTSNDDTYWGGKRQKLVSQELLGIGYYIVTVDGQHATIDYYSATSYASSATGFNISTTPDLKFVKKESFGYSLNGKDFLVPYGSDYTAVDVTSSGGTRSKILAGTCLYSKVDMGSRNYNVLVNTGYYNADDATSSDMLYLRGMDYNMGSGLTDTFALSLSYDDATVTDALITAKSFGLAKLNENGVWENAVNANHGGTPTFVNGPWASGYGLGTWGVDTTSKTVWAVINSNGYFAAVKNI